MSDGVVTIWLNRPDRRNAFNQAMRIELYQAFDGFERDDAVRAIVVTGSGRYFSAGADLERGGSTFSGPRDDEARRQEEEARARQFQPWRMRTPIIAALNGPAVGLGITLPLQWDIRYAAEDAKYGLVFNRRGVIPEANSLWLLPRLVGLSRSFELLLSGRLFTGREAAEIGLVSRALPADDVLPAAQELARDIAANTSPVSVAVTKALAYRFLTEPDRDAAHEMEWATFRWMGRQLDAAEGVTSFLEKRPPQWKLSKTNDFPPTVG
ncbi:MAG: enoyl-CoA hydratase [Streptosporangiales bacterium]|nr:enoyl-CoA hydratase [Streptosporangiales bacterium]